MPEEVAVAQTPPKSRRLLITLALIAGIAVLEGAAFFAAIKVVGGGPAPSYGQEGEHYVEAAPADQTAGTEVSVVKHFKVPNTKSGRTVIYDLDVTVLVGPDRAAAMEALTQGRQAQVADRLAQVVRAADPRVMNEFDFRTLRLQIRNALNELAGDNESVRQVLIPRCVPIQGD